MKISVFPENSSIAGRPIFHSFINSFNDIHISNDLNGDVAVIWSVLWNGRMAANQKIWEIFRSRNKPVIVLEVGALKRNQTWKVGINGINRDATWIKPFGDVRHDLSLQPWKTSGTDIVVCGQHGKSEQWSNMPPMDQWMIDVVGELRRYTKRKIVLRPHPRFPVKPDYVKEFSNVLVANPKKVEGSYDDFNFEETLEKCWAVVNHSSGPATSAVMQGVPVFVSNHSLAYDVGNDINRLDLIETPRYPDRENWLKNISYTEWTTEEIASGLVWEKIRDLL